MAKKVKYNYEKSGRQQRDVIVGCHVTLFKDVRLKTDAFRIDYDGDSDLATLDETEVDWAEAYADTCHSIEEMLAILADYVRHDLSVTGAYTGRGQWLKNLLNDCQGWITKETYFEE